jgi:uncharacterized SAM-binding protein YcdF (DUF218 family)
MFIASKLLALLAQPLHWVIALLVLALALRRHPVAARRLTVVSVLLLVLLGWQPLPDLLLRPLESAYPEFAPDADLSGYTGVVVLGGALEPGYLAQAHQQPLLGESAERMTAAVALVQRHPKLRLVFSGGEGQLFGSGPSEAERAARFFSSMGVEPQRITLEAASRNTYENAVMGAALPGIDPRQRWLLLTSAWHMPRAMGSFEKAGWNVTAYPVDHRTAQTTPWTQYALHLGAAKWHMVLREWLGLAAYRITGRIG